MKLYCNHDNSYLFVNRKEIFNFTTDDKNINFLTLMDFISNGFDATESVKVSFKGNVYDFIVNDNAIDKSDILNIHKYLMVKSNIK